MEGLLAVLDGAPIAQSGLVGLCLAGAYAILTGRLVPRLVLEDTRQDRDRWQVALQTSEAAREKQAAALRDALEIARSAEDALRGFRTAAQRFNGESA